MMQFKRGLAKFLADKICLSIEDTRKITVREGVTNKDAQGELYYWLTLFEDFVEDDANSLYRKVRP